MRAIDISICCATYNQKKYIKKTIDSFINQISDTFTYEIIIHDDCSTDGTIDILKEYEKAHSNLHVIFQEKNQFSQGEKIIPILVNQAKGKYIAFCEGDDFWNSPNKLKKQFAYMEENPKCSLCIHSANVINECEEFLEFCKCSENSAVIPINQIILKDGNYIPTCSTFYRRSDLDTFPNEYLECPIGDYPLQIYLGEKGYCFYIDEPLASYRVHSQGSLTDDYINNRDKLIALRLDLIKMYRSFDERYNFMYHNSFQEKETMDMFDVFVFQRCIRELMHRRYLKIFLKKSLTEKSKVILRLISPRLERHLRKWKTKL